MSKKEQIISEAVLKLKNCAGLDNESMHGNADIFLCEALIKLGCKDIVEAYQELEPNFWYA